MKLIICDDYQKNIILKQVHTLDNIKFITIETLENHLFGTINDLGKLYLYKKYNLNFDLINEINTYLKYIDVNKIYNSIKINYLLNIKKDLINHNYYEYNLLYLNTIKRSNIIYTYDINSKRFNYIYNYLRNITKNIELIKFKYSNNLNKVYRLNNINDEVNYIFNDIYNKVKNHKANLKDILIVSQESSYYLTLYRVAKNYNINLNIKNNNSIIGSKDVKVFLDNINNKVSLNDSLKEINSSYIHSKIINIINKYNFNDDNILDYYNILVKLIKKIQYEDIKYKDAINVETIIKPNYKYIYFLNFNYNIPSLVNDDLYLSDKELSLLNLDTSVNINNMQELNLITLLSNTNSIITYPKVLLDKENADSFLISKYNLEYIDIKDRTLNNSQVEDYIYLSHLLDNKRLYKTSHEFLNIYNLNDLNYYKYKHQFKKISQSYIDSHPLDHKFNISYTSIKNYYDCKFAFYCNNVLRLSEFEQTNEAKLGTYAHDLLENSYKDNFNYDLLSNKLKANFDPKLKFYSDILDNKIRRIIEFNQKNDKKDLKVLCEEKFELEINKFFKIKGFIDKLYIYENEEDVYLFIVDYKTGKDEANLDSIDYGKNLQLPIYEYLVKKANIFKDKNIKIGGLYLQKVEISPDDDEIEINEDESVLFLQGYTNEDYNIYSKFTDISNKATHIKSFKLNKNNNFYNHAKTLNDEEFELIYEITDKVLNDGINNIINYDFEINPSIFNKFSPCVFCKFLRICYKNKLDYVEVPKNQNWNIIDKEEKKDA